MNNYLAGLNQSKSAECRLIYRTGQKGQEISAQELGYLAKGGVKKTH